jgi:ribosomal protein S13
LAAGRITLIAALGDERAASMQLLDLYVAAPGLGRRTAPRLLSRVDVRSNLRVRELTKSQLERLRQGLLDPDYIARRTW